MTDRTHPDSGRTTGGIVEMLQDRVAELEAQLEAIGAGGVSDPLMGKPQEMPDLSALTERGSKAWAGVDAQGLREGFTAADMATAESRGFRDGVASLAANAPAPSAHIKEPYTLAEIKAKIASNDYSAEMLLQHAMLLLDSAPLSASAGGEPVYQARYQKGFWQDSSRERYEYLQNPENTCAEDWEMRILHTHPSTPEGMAVTDAMIDAGKKMLHNSNGRGAREKVERIFNAMIALAAPPTAQAEGWRLVPVEPTTDQEWAGKQAALRGSTMAEACKIYKAMLAAAPLPPTSAEGAEHG